MEKCKRWLVACSREFFADKNITRSTYICALHWPGDSSFIDEECVDEKCVVMDTHICVNPSGKLVSDQGSQTIIIIFEIQVVCKGQKYGFEKQSLCNCKIPLFQYRP